MLYKATNWQTDKKSLIIADGGIKNSGDIVKALAAGADAVMIGSLLAGTIEAPGDIIYDKERNSYKTYRGMASKEAQVAWRGRAASVEGISAMVPTKGPVSVVMDRISLGIRSGLSYTGARKVPGMSDLCKEKVIFSLLEKKKVDLKIKLHRESLTQSLFFSAIVDAYIEDDPAFVAWLEKSRPQFKISKARQKLLAKEENTAAENMKKFGFNKDELQSIFDLIVKEREES